METARGCLKLNGVEVINKYELKIAFLLILFILLVVLTSFVINLQLL